MNTSSHRVRPKLFSNLENGVFVFFLIWMGIGLVVTLNRLTEQSVSDFPLSTNLLRFIQFCLRYGDPISILLAAVPTYWSICRIWGTVPSRRWTLMVLGLSAAIETLGTLSGWPFGRYHYTANFGPRIGGLLPCVIPFSWFVLVTNFLLLVRHLNYLPRGAAALMVAAGVTTLDWIMEPFAVKIKGYWLWESGIIPFQNYLSWFMITFILAFYLAPPASRDLGRTLRPLLILGSMVTLFISSRWVNSV